MMTEQEIKEFNRLSEKFNSECSRVARILSFSRVRTQELCNISFAENFYLSNNDRSVCWTGEEYWSYGGHESHEGNFSVEFLFKTDEELQEIVNKENVDYEEECARKKALQKQREKDQRREEFLRLKEEFEPENSLE